MQFPGIMALPELIEIEPLTRRVQARIALPGSKSITNRALVLAALAPVDTRLEGALWSEDTQVMVECLQTLGYLVHVAPDPAEPANRTITVYPLGGQLPPGGTVQQPLELFVGNSGTTARFLAALVCLGRGAYRLAGVSRMHERPQAALFQALRDLGYQVESPNDKLPVLIHGAGPRPGQCRVSIQESSQFASALLLCAAHGGWQVEVMGENADESPYVAMTRQIVALFSQRPGSLVIEPDASSGSYFWAAAWINAMLPPARQTLAALSSTCSLANGSAPGVSEPLAGIVIERWPNSGWQIDEAFPRFWPLADFISRRSDLGDSIMTAMIMAALADRTIRFTDLGRLRLQECERVTAMRTELGRCGARVFEQGDTLEIQPGALHGATIETYEDHRIAMCFAILGLKVPGIKIKNPACVKKTFPDFFQKLAAAAPRGLGAVIRESGTGRQLAVQELFAD